MPAAVTSRVDPQGTSHAEDPALFPPLAARWELATDASPRGAVAGEGLIFVVTENSLDAYEPATSARRWTAPIAGGGALAYDGGRLFVLVGNALVAVSGADGRELWRRTLTTNADPPSDPVASGGRVYITTSSDTIALDAATGVDAWRAVSKSSAGAVAVDGERVYASIGCGFATAFARFDGRELWALVQRLRRTAWRGADRL